MCLAGVVHLSDDVVDRGFSLPFHVGCGGSRWPVFQVLGICHGSVKELIFFLQFFSFPFQVEPSWAKDAIPEPWDDGWNRGADQLPGTMS